MVDINAPLMVVLIGCAQLVLWTKLDLSRPAVKWPRVAAFFGAAALALATLLGHPLRAPVPQIVADLILVTGMVLMLAIAFFYIRDEARRLREAKTQPGQ